MRVLILPGWAVEFTMKRIKHHRADPPKALAEGFCEAVERRAADLPGQDRRRGLPRD